MTHQDIDFGILDSATTQVFGEDTYHVLLKGQKGGTKEWPYAPEVLQRRNNTFHAALSITIRPKYWKRLPSTSFFDCCSEMKAEGYYNGLNDFEVLIVKMRRPAAPCGVEWNCPGGIIEMGEKSRASMIRECREETGLTPIALARIFNNLQFSSGVYRELYDIYAVLVDGVPKIAVNEGGLIWNAVNLSGWKLFVQQEQVRSLKDSKYCGIDGKVIMGVQEIIRRFAEIGIK